MSDENPNKVPPPDQAPPAEDAGSQALSDALRSSFFIVKIIMVVLVLAFLSSGFFTVGPQEKAILLRMGKPVGEGEQALFNPGPHWAFPKPIDEIERIPASIGARGGVLGRLDAHARRTPNGRDASLPAAEPPALTLPRPATL